MPDPALRSSSTASSSDADATPTLPQSLAAVLAETREWPVDTVAAAVVSPEGIVEAIGPTERSFALASVTKPLVATAILLAVEEGAVELSSTPAACGLAAADLPDETLRTEATLEHYLAHASGIAFSEWTPEQPMGQRRLYSSAGFEVAAEMVARATDIAFPDYLADGVCAPLRMGKTELDGSAGHGARSSVEDVAAWLASHLAVCGAHSVGVEPLAKDSPGTVGLLAPETVRDAWTTRFGDLAGIVPGYGRQTPCPWALGWEVKGDKRKHWTGLEQPGETVGHFGQSGTFVWVDPAAARAAVVLTDRDFGPWAAERWRPFNDRLWVAVRGDSGDA